MVVAPGGSLECSEGVFRSCLVRLNVSLSPRRSHDQLTDRPSLDIQSEGQREKRNLLQGLAKKDQRNEHMELH